MAEADQDDIKTGNELLEDVVEQHKAQLVNQQEKHEYELQQNQKKLNAYGQTIRELQEKLGTIDEKTSENLLYYDIERKEIDKKEREKLSRLHQHLRDSPVDTLRQILADTHHDKVRFEEQNIRLLTDLHETRQMVASMKKGSRSGDKADGAEAQELIKTLETRLNEEVAESKKLNDKIEELHQRIESLQKQSENKEIGYTENTEEDDDLESEGQFDRPAINPEKCQTDPPKAKTWIYLLGVMVVALFAIVGIIAYRSTINDEGQAIFNKDNNGWTELEITDLIETLDLLHDGHFPDHHWLELGLNLGLPHPKLKTIEDDTKGAQRRLNEMLSLWLTRGKATWSGLGTALSKMEEYKSAE